MYILISNQYWYYLILVKHVYGVIAFGIVLKIKFIDQLQKYIFRPKKRKF